MTARHLAFGLLVFLVLACASAASAGDGVVALQTCEVSCPDDSTDLYVACGNGTVTDNRTGLVWLANANCFGQLTWNDAMALVAGLGDLPHEACGGMGPDECDCGLSDHSSPGEWRLPSMAEWKTMIAAGLDSDVCQPAILNDMGNACWEQGCFDTSTCSFYGVEPATYWSSTSYPSSATWAWLGDLAGGGITIADKGESFHVWPVRGGQ